MLRSSEIFLLATLIPLAGSVILTLLQRYLKASSPYLATGFILLSLATVIFGLVEHISHAMTNVLSTSVFPALPWIQLASPTSLLSTTIHTSGAGMIGDPLTAMMLMVILVLAVPGQIFLMMYLKRSDEPPYFYALLCLFIFAAMAACLATTLLALMALAYVAAIVGYVVLVGLTRPGHNGAVWRSLVMISAGMSCFLIAVSLLISQTGLTSEELFNPAGLSTIVPHLQAALGVESYVQILHFRSGPSAAGLNFLTWSGVGFVLFGLALAGQFPFQACPLDTLESPAPLNGLLTGAILPLLGIYIVGRLYPFFTLDTRLIMAIAGCTTLSTALLSAWVQTDIKHMTWWIICGQYGWCFLLFGSGAWVQAMEHAMLWTTLALGLFSASGVVLACTGGQGDVRTLGGLWKKLPVTAGAALVFVVIGSQMMNVIIPGELPHELIWLHHYGRGLEGFGRLLYWVPLAAVGLNSLVLWRWWWLIFGGTGRNAAPAPAVSRESAVLTLPLVLLMALAVGIQEPFFGINALLAHAAPNTLAVQPVTPSMIGAAPWQLWLPVVGTMVALVLYFRGLAIADRLRRVPGLNLLYIWFRGEFFLKEVSLIIPGLLLKGLALAVIFLDRTVLELLLIFTALFMRAAGMVVSLVEEAWSAGIWDHIMAIPIPGPLSRFLNSGRVRGGLVLLISAGMVAAAIIISMALA